MRVLSCLLIFMCCTNLVSGQSTLERGCTNSSRLVGPGADSKNFKYIPDRVGSGYYEVTAKPVAAYLTCGKQIDIRVGEVIQLHHDLYRGSYDGHSGIWGETFVDFDGVGPDASTFIYVLLDDLKKLPSRPAGNFYKERIEGELLNEEITLFMKWGLLALAAVLLTVVLLIIRRSSRRNRSSSRTAGGHSVTSGGSGSGPLNFGGSSASSGDDKPSSFWSEHEKKQQKIRDLDADIAWREMHGHGSSDLLSGDLERKKQERDDLYF